MSSEPWLVRPATPDDAAACAALYAPYVTDTAITFETEVPTADAFAARIGEANRLHAWLVLEVDGAVAGYAYAHAFHTRAAYGWACESSIYLEMGRRRTGAGRALYGALLARIAQRGYRRVIGVITQPNEASNGLHRSFGFTDVGTLHRVGWKHGAWHDVAYLELDLAPHADPSDPPKPIA